ncbi:MAG TPA: transporter [Caulobacter sp.]|nr:transporter [Caulobacter sp.]
MKVCLLTPAHEETAYRAVYPPWFDTLAAALATAGIEAGEAAWTEAVPPGFDAVLPMIAWGYHVRPALWSAQLDALEAAGMATINPLPILRWNTDKAYLEDLGAKGVPVVPTVSLERLSAGDIEAARARFGCEVVVAKPRISGGAFQTLKLAPGDPLEGAPEGPAMIQPFLPAVGEEGELSLFYFGGVFSHAVAKVAADGDFRVQVQFGGQTRRVDPWPGALAVAEAVLAAVPPLAYARIDMIRGLDGTLQLMELEAIEPDLFLSYAPEAGAKFGAAVRAALTAF